MTESKEEMEIVSTMFYQENNAYCISSIRKAEKKVSDIAQNIIKLREELNCAQNKVRTSKSDNVEVCRIKELLTDMEDKYEVALSDLLKLAKILNFDIQNLEYKKFDIDRTKIENTVHESIIQAGKENDEEIAPIIVINDDKNVQNVIFYDQNNSRKTRCIENDDESLWTNSDEPERCSKCISSEGDNVKRCCSKSSEELDTDEYEKEMIREDLMLMKGEVKLLHQQNRDLLTKLNYANKRTSVLSNSMRNKPPSVKYKNGVADSNDKKSNTAILLNEVSRLREELKESKRDRCQIELARKLLNISDSQCVNCVGSSCKSDLKKLTDDYEKLSLEYKSKVEELAQLKDALDAVKLGHKTYGSRLTVAVVQIAQLEKQIHEITSAKIDDPKTVCSNDKLAIENLKNCVQEVTDEKTNMQMVLDFHLSELEDKKLKYMEVFQMNQEQKNQIESLCEEKTTFAKKYEMEFNLMSDYLKARLEEIGTLPGMLASTQKNLLKEKTDKKVLESDLKAIKNEISSVRTKLEKAELMKNDNKLEQLKLHNSELRATVKSLRETMAENERLYRERTHYSLQLKDHLDAVREEAAIQVTKTKDFSECQRNQYTDYIRKLEKQLADCKTLTCAENKKRNQIDEGLRHRIVLLTKNVNEAQKRVVELSNAKNIVEAKIGEELCNLPLKTKQSCEEKTIFIKPDRSRESYKQQSIDRSFTFHKRV